MGCRSRFEMLQDNTQKSASQVNECKLAYTTLMLYSTLAVELLRLIIYFMEIVHHSHIHLLECVGVPHGAIAKAGVHQQLHMAAVNGVRRQAAPVIPQNSPFWACHMSRGAKHHPVHSQSASTFVLLQISGYCCCCCFVVLVEYNRKESHLLLWYTNLNVLKNNIVHCIVIFSE